MKRLMCVAKLFVGDMGINLGGRDVGMTEHCLDGANVGAIA